MSDSLAGKDVAHVSRHMLFKVAAPIVAQLSTAAVNSLESHFYTPDNNQQPNEAGQYAVAYSFVYGKDRVSSRIANADVDDLAKELADQLEGVVQKLRVGDKAL